MASSAKNPELSQDFVNIIRGSFLNEWMSKKNKAIQAYLFQNGPGHPNRIELETSRGPQCLSLHTLSSIKPSPKEAGLPLGVEVEVSYVSPWKLLVNFITSWKKLMIVQEKIPDRNFSFELDGFIKISPSRAHFKSQLKEVRDNTKIQSFSQLADELSKILPQSLKIKKNSMN